MTNQNAEEKNKIRIALQEEIDGLKEYLHSDICKACGNIALKLEEKLDLLNKILSEI